MFQDQTTTSWCPNGGSGALNNAPSWDMFHDSEHQQSTKILRSSRTMYRYRRCIIAGALCILCGLCILVYCAVDTTRVLKGSSTTHASSESSSSNSSSSAGARGAGSSSSDSSSSSSSSSSSTGAGSSSSDRSSSSALGMHSAADARATQEKRLEEEARVAADAMLEQEHLLSGEASGDADMAFRADASSAEERNALVPSAGGIPEVAALQDAHDDEKTSKLDTDPRTVDQLRSRRDALFAQRADLEKAQTSSEATLRSKMETCAAHHASLTMVSHTHAQLVTALKTFGSDTSVPLREEVIEAAKKVSIAFAAFYTHDNNNVHHQAEIQKIQNSVQELLDLFTKKFVGFIDADKLVLSQVYKLDVFVVELMRERYRRMRVLAETQEDLYIYEDLSYSAKLDSSSMTIIQSLESLLKKKSTLESQISTNYFKKIRESQVNNKMWDESTDKDALELKEQVKKIEGSDLRRIQQRINSELDVLEKSKKFDAKEHFLNRIRFTYQKNTHELLLHIINGIFNHQNWIKQRQGELFQQLTSDTRVAFTSEYKHFQQKLYSLIEYELNVLARFNLACVAKQKLLQTLSELKQPLLDNEVEYIKLVEELQPIDYEMKRITDLVTKCKEAVAVLEREVSTTKSAVQKINDEIADIDAKLQQCKA